MTRALPPIAVAHGFSFELLTFCELDMSRNSFTDIIFAGLAVPENVEGGVPGLNQFPHDGLP